MTLNLENESDHELSFDYEDVAKKVILAALDYEQCPYESEINLLLTSDEEIHRTNREFRDTDRVTDVLSFPMISFPVPGEFAFLEEEMDAFHPETGELLLGDIMIAIPRMRQQAEEYGHGEIREFGFLIAHSMLHLMGYDHMTPEEARVMEEKQEAILEGLAIRRSPL